MNNVITIIFLLLASKGSFLYTSNASWFIILFLYIGIGLHYKRFTYYDLRVIGNFSLVFLSLMVFRYYFLNDLPLRYLITDVLFLIKYMFVCFLFFALLKEQTMIYLVKVIYWGAVISIPLYFFQLVAGNVLYTIGRSLPLAQDINHYSNIYIFTYVLGHHDRNCGFVWEPGAYGCFLNIALMVNLAHNRFVIDKKSKWFVAAIITTLSTTSYLALLIIVLMYYRANGGKFSKIIFIGGPMMVALAFNLPFLFDKISKMYVHDMNDVDNIQFLSEYYLENGGELPLNRFSSAVYLWELFGIHLLWGVSNPYQDTVTILKNVNISNGIIDFCAKFGVMGLSYLLYCFGKFYNLYVKSAELTFYSVLILLTLSFGEPILILPISLIFLFVNYYVNEEDMVYDDRVYEELQVN